MQKTELFEEIRSLLSEPQSATVSKPWHYTDEQLIPQVRSALRFLRTRGAKTTGMMTTDGVFTVDPGTETEGSLLALYVASRLVSGDLMQKLASGELGVAYQAGSDSIDTKNAADTFKQVSKRYDSEFQSLLTITLSVEDGGVNSAFGTQVPYSLDP
jgi:hypothetical protein